MCFLIYSGSSDHVPIVAIIDNGKTVRKMILILILFSNIYKCRRMLTQTRGRFLFPLDLAKIDTLDLSTILAPYVTAFSVFSYNCKIRFISFFFTSLFSLIFVCTFKFQFFSSSSFVSQFEFPPNLLLTLIRAKIISNIFFFFFFVVSLF